MHAMPILILILCLMAIAYRYYSAFLAARVAVLDDTRQTPAEKFNDGKNFHPTSKWVLFGHHFAAISGAGPLIGPVLAAQFGYLPGLLWIVIGVCLAGAVQDFLVLAASIHRNGKSLARITFSDIGRVAGTASMIAILFIIVIALAGLGKVVVKALGGEQVTYPVGSVLVQNRVQSGSAIRAAPNMYFVPDATEMTLPGTANPINLGEGFAVYSKTPLVWKNDRAVWPAGAVRLVPGSSWGVFTIACTIPIALLMGLYMYRIRPGKVVEASVIGAALTLAAVFAGAWVSHGSAARWFNLTSAQVTWSMAIYGFIAAVLPVWVLLAPRDYLSSFLKIGTIFVLVIGVIVANPRLQAPAINHVFLHGGPTVPGSIFPFLFITIMCGAISGFHALVSSGTTPKMIRRESDARAIGYGAMLIEGLVGVVTMLAAASLPTNDYYAMNTELAKAPQFQEKILQVGGGGGIEHIQQYESLTQESLRGRTGGAVTLAVGMAHIFDEAARRFSVAGEPVMQSLWKYWYHFAIMFEALFILTTIDAGTRIGRFLLQEVFHVIHPKLAEPGWWPGTIVSTAAIVLGWVYFINSGSFAAIWAMFGVANQMLAVIALAVVTVVLANEGRVRYAWVTVLPMIVVGITTTTAALELLHGHYLTLITQWAKPVADGKIVTAAMISGSLIVAMLICTYTIMACGAMKIWPQLRDARRPVRPVGRALPANV